MNKPANMWQQMPHTAAWIDDLRAAFGADAINATIRLGMQGNPGCFYASENGHQVGTPSPPPAAHKTISAEHLVLGSNAELLGKGVSK